jgi:DNA-binding LacI/PurR family transcriptional regulator
MTEAGRLFAPQRQERVLEELRQHGAVRVRELAATLSVSELTVRRDISALASRGLLTRVHGGATLSSSPGRPSGPARRPRPAPAALTIGMVVPSLDFYWPPIVDGARAAAVAHGAGLQLRGSCYDQAEDRRQVERLIADRQVRGLLLAPSLEEDRTGEMIDWLDSLPVPVVLVERQTPRWTPTRRQAEWVRSDHALGLEMAVRHLHDQGHRRIGLVLSKGSPTSADLLVGWRRACADLALPDGLVVRESVAPGVPGGPRIIEDLLVRCRAYRATALIVHSDPDAAAVARHFTEHGVSIPGDMALVSYDDENAEAADPPMTAVRPSKRRVGRIAVEMMVSRLLEGARRPAQRVLVLPELVVRASSVRCPGGPRRIPAPGPARP